MRPDFVAVHAAARRERARQLHTLILAPIAALFRRPSKPVLREVACHW
jgi:hypothetical protein